MDRQSAVQFATESRIHIGLAVKNLESSIAFYRALFGQEPTKQRPGYAKFEVPQPPVNLSLNQVELATGPDDPVSHFGIQVKSTAAVRALGQRLALARIATRIEESVTCCYAVADKVWATDPDGNRWEIYVVLDDNGAHHHSSAGLAAEEVAAIQAAVERQDWPAAMAAFQKAGGMTRLSGSPCCAMPSDRPAATMV